MVSQSQIEHELNNRNYYKKVSTDGGGLAPPNTLPPDQTPPGETPPDGTGGQGMIDKYGNFLAIGAALMFALAIFPGQTESGGAE